MKQTERERLRDMILRAIKSHESARLLNERGLKHEAYIELKGAIGALAYCLEELLEDSVIR